MAYIEIDIERLRNDLKDYYGTAGFNGFPAAIMELADVENMSEEQLIRFAVERGVNLEKYS